MTIAALWIAILASAIAVFIVSSIVWMVLPHHKSDFKPVPDEEAARSALKGIPVGQYNLPHMADRAAMATEEGRRKMEEGPMALMIVWPNGVPNMGKQLGIWFVFCIIVSVVAAYVASRTLPSSVAFTEAFRVTGTVAWLAYGFGSVQESIWFGRPWSMTVKMLGDALAYAVATGLCFGFFWPG
ncbi:MAG: hypothetical protein V3T39_06940 [Gammaproteobacteria bacterium]